MHYISDIGNEQKLEIENDGETTHVGFSSGGTDQQQSQYRGFTTGKWKNLPTLYRGGNQLILELDTDNGPRYLSILGNRINRLDHKPDLSQSRKLPLNEAMPTPKMKPMEPMKPMAPMKPM